MTDREKLIEEMALHLKERSAKNPYVSWLDAASDALSIAEKALAEKYARIANLHEGCSASQMESLRCEAGEEIADAILATVEKKND